MNQETLVNQIKHNLSFYNLWTDITEIKTADFALLQGIPKDPLTEQTTVDSTKDTATESSGNKNHPHEIVYPIKIDDKLTPKQIHKLFEQAGKAKGFKVEKIIAGILNDDSTIVYYNIYNGLVKPRRN